MSLGVPLDGTSSMEDNVGAMSSPIGTVITAAGSSHTKGAFSAGELIASTASTAYGIAVFLTGTGTVASTNERCLCDIGIGASGSESVLIPNLLCGNVGVLDGPNNSGVMYYFPIKIPAASRISARCQALIASDTVNVSVWLYESPIGPGGWYGSRVTDYGTNTGTSSGVSHTSGNAAYAAATQITASTTNPIKALQLGIDLGTDTTGTNKRGIIRVGVGAGPTYIASDLPWGESTTLETVNQVWANFLLSHMRFDIPAAQSLHVSAQVDASSEARGHILYGVD